MQLHPLHPQFSQPFKSMNIEGKFRENPSFCEQKCHFRKYFISLWIKASAAWLERAYSYDQNLFLQGIKVGGFYNSKENT